LPDLRLVPQVGGVNTLFALRVLGQGGMKAVPLRRMAASDYKTPCPYCYAPPNKGQWVVHMRGFWWHEHCFKRWLKLRKQRT